MSKLSKLVKTIAVGVAATLTQGNAETTVNYDVNDDIPGSDKEIKKENLMPQLIFKSAGAGEFLLAQHVSHSSHSSHSSHHSHHSHHSHSSSSGQFV